MNKYLAEASQLILARRYMDAAELCRKALRKSKDVVVARKLLADCHYNQGVIHLFYSGLLHNAEEQFRLALQHNPRHVDALNNLGGLRVQQKRFEEAIEFYQQALSVEPGRINALKDLAQTYQRLDRLDEASTTLLRLAELMPDDGSALLRDALLIRSIIPDLGYPAQVRERIRDRLAAFEASGRSIADPAWFPGTYFYLSYHGLCNKELHQAIARAHLRAAPSLAWEAPHVDKWRGSSGRTRIGIASTNLCNHSIGHTSRGLVEILDRERFEVVVVRVGPAPADDIAAAIDRAADQVVVVPHGDLHKAREAIAALSLDILFWQDIGMDPITYLLAYARLAPVQVTSFGHPDTTGIPNMDYFISSSLYEVDGARGDYSEKLVTLPDLGTLAYYYRPAVPAETDRRDFGLKDDEHVYLCPQALFKLHPEMDDVLLEIVERDNKARIVLIEPALSHMRDAVESRMTRLSPRLGGRLHFIKSLPHARYLSLLRCADVMLDTLHFNGQNTSLEGFAVGVPIVTLPGRLQRSRHTYGMYRAMNFMELVADSKSDYAAKALAVATDPAFRAHCQARITESAGVLYENTVFVRHCEEAFVNMVEQTTWTSGNSNL
ncbi:MAG TPA: tetratricopeptide repeat protein [Thiobacillaceae bacterium]|nr:tetratricopeptide repeat protein [Thiobacillaceae bacterium]